MAKGSYSRGSRAFSDLFGAVSAYADGFVDVVAKYATPDGSLAEQFSRDDGHPLSVRDLTWSYAAVLTAAARRAGVVPPSWASENATSIPATCSATSVVGSYSSATATSFPPSQTPKTGVPPTITRTPTPTSIAVTFKVLAITQFGQTIKIVGNAGSLGNWITDRAVTLDASGYPKTCATADKSDKWQS